MNMATITLKYDGRNIVAKKFIDLALSLGVFSVEKKPKTEIELSLEDADKKHFFTAKNGKEVISKCLEDV